MRVSQTPPYFLLSLYEALVMKKSKKDHDQIQEHLFISLSKSLTYSSYNSSEYSNLSYQSKFL